MRIKQLLSLTLFLNVFTSVAAQDKRPNIVLIMADDMGFSDIGCYGGEVQTPNLDKLAANGLRFKQFYNNARCCPSRAALVTGVYPHQAGIGHMTNDPEDRTAFNYGVPAYQGDLNNQCVTIAEVLKSAGYNTFMTGKWHLGYHDRARWPLQRGFDKYYGILAGAANYFHPTGERGLTLMNNKVEPEGNDFYITDAFTNYAMKFINENKSLPQKTPFFLYLAYTSPHWPLNALQADVDKYRNQYKAGWSALRKTRFEKMKQMGIIDRDLELSEADGVNWDGLSEEKKDEMDHRMALYAAQIDRMDQNIGKLIATLEANGELENTLILFVADNGACAEGGQLGGGGKALLGTKEGYFLSYGQSWANVSNTPFRKYKHWVHEGGMSSPLIVHWPSRMSAVVKGKLTAQYGFFQDIMATCVEAASARYPKTFKGHAIVPMQGSSLLPLVKGKDKPVHNSPIFWEHEGNGAVRMGNFKLVKEYKPKNSSNWELYDISKDRSEVNDLALFNPALVKELSQQYDKWALSVGVLPYEEVLRICKSKARQ